MNIREIKFGDKTLRVTCFSEEELDKLKSSIQPKQQKKLSFWEKFKKWTYNIFK